jgi:hypothetical protein
MNSHPFSSSGRFIAVCLAALALPPAVAPLSAQTAVSNLLQSTSGTSNIGTQAGGETYRRAFSFTTGSNSGGYDFSGITFPFATASGTPNPLTVELFSAFDMNTIAGGGGLLSSLSLTSGNPLVSGDAIYSGIASLNASSSYYLLLSAGAAIASGNNYTYLLSTTYAEDAGGLAGWQIVDGSYYATPTSTWTAAGSLGRFSVQASAVPEPSTFASLAGLVVLGFAATRRRREVSSPALN